MSASKDKAGKRRSISLLWLMRSTMTKQGIFCNLNGMFPRKGVWFCLFKSDFIRMLVNHVWTSKITYGEIVCIKFVSWNKCIYYRAENPAFSYPKVVEGISQPMCQFASICSCKLQSSLVSVCSIWRLPSLMRQRRQADLQKEVLKVGAKPLVTHEKFLWEGSCCGKEIKWSV